MPSPAYCDAAVGLRLQPCSETKALAIVQTHQDDVCRPEEHGLRYLLPRLEIRPRNGSATCTILARHEAKPRTKVTALLECLTGADGGHDGGRDQRAVLLKFNDGVQRASKSSGFREGPFIARGTSHWRTTGTARTFGRRELPKAGCRR